MTYPLIILAVMAAVAGFLNLPGDDWLGHTIEGWLPEHTEELVTHRLLALDRGVIDSTGSRGAWSAWLIYQVRVLDAAKIRAFLQPLPEILDNRYYLDALYEDVFVKTILLGGTRRARSRCGTSMSLTGSSTALAG